MKYKIAEDSEVQRASVDGIRLGYLRDPVELEDGQVARLEGAGIKLEKVTDAELKKVEREREEREKAEAEHEVALRALNNNEEGES